jgi:hypothetical protein
VGGPDKSSAIANPQIFLVSKPSANVGVWGYAISDPIHFCDFGAPYLFADRKLPQIRK